MIRVRQCFVLVLHELNHSSLRKKKKFFSNKKVFVVFFVCVVVGCLFVVAAAYLLCPFGLKADLTMRQRLYEVLGFVAFRLLEQFHLLDMTKVYRNSAPSATTAASSTSSSSGGASHVMIDLTTTGHQSESESKKKKKKLNFFLKVVVNLRLGKGIFLVNMKGMKMKINYMKQIGVVVHMTQHQYRLLKL